MPCIHNLKVAVLIRGTLLGVEGSCVLYLLLGFGGGVRFSTALRVAFMRPTLGIINWGPFVIGYLLVHGVLALM